MQAPCLWTMSKESSINTAQKEKSLMEGNWKRNFQETIFYGSTTNKNQKISLLC